MTDGPIRDLLDAPFDQEDAERVHARLSRSLDAADARPRSRSWTPAATLALAAALLLCVAVGGWALTSGSDRAGPLMELGSREVFARAEAVGARRELRLSDSSVVALTRGTRLEALSNTRSELSLVMSDGKAVFDVKPGGPRHWTIDASWLVVDVLGTRFSVERAASHAEVIVERGVVRVRGALVPGGVRRLTAGESIRVEMPRAETRPAASAGVSPDGTSPPSAIEPPAEAHIPPAIDGPRHRQQIAPSADWRAQVQEGDYERAFATLSSSGFERELSAATDIATLMALADVARLSGHPREAVAALSRVVALHADDQRAALAAFTLGRIELESLRQPGPAAQSFERALTLGLPSGLERPAHVRAVEAYVQAGDRSGARRLAQRYIERYGADALPATIESALHTD